MEMFAVGNWDGRSVERYVKRTLHVMYGPMATLAGRPPPPVPPTPLVDPWVFSNFSNAAASLPPPDKYIDRLMAAAGLWIRAATGLPFPSSGDDRENVTFILNVYKPRAPQPIAFLPNPALPPHMTALGLAATAAAVGAGAGGLALATGSGALMAAATHAATALGVTGAALSGAPMAAATAASAAATIVGAPIAAAAAAGAGTWLGATVAPYMGSTAGAGLAAAAAVGGVAAAEATAAGLGGAAASLLGLGGAAAAAVAKGEHAGSAPIQFYPFPAFPGGASFAGASGAACLPAAGACPPALFAAQCGVSVATFAFDYLCRAVDQRVRDLSPQDAVGLKVVLDHLQTTGSSSAGYPLVPGAPAAPAALPLRSVPALGPAVGGLSVADIIKLVAGEYESLPPLRDFRVATAGWETDDRTNINRFQRAAAISKYAEPRIADLVAGGVVREAAIDTVAEGIRAQFGDGIEDIYKGVRAKRAPRAAGAGAAAAAAGDT
jgi:hypothetical protein